MYVSQVFSSLQISLRFLNAVVTTNRTNNDAYYAVLSAPLPFRLHESEHLPPVLKYSLYLFPSWPETMFQTHTEQSLAAKKGNMTVLHLDLMPCIR
jgi:hypothetical protein